MKKIERNDNEVLRKKTKEDSYDEIYNYNIQIINDFFTLYYDKNKNKDISIDDNTVRSIILSMYIDPDSSSIKERNGIKCSADGLISIKRLYSYEKATNQLIEDYKKYRKYPIFHFPQESNGINQSRASSFGDRIDHTLFDIKNFYIILKKYNGEKSREKVKKYYNEQNILKIILINAFTNQQTFNFLTSFDSFEDFIKWEFDDNQEMIKIFIDTKKEDDYTVYDLEKNDNSIIEKYLQKYEYNWSKEYYENLKQKITEYNNIKEK